MSWPGDPGLGPDVHPFLGAIMAAASHWLRTPSAWRRGSGARRPVSAPRFAARAPGDLAITGHDYWRALGYTGFFLNLFNLLPVVPLDGGRAMAAMSPWMWFLGSSASRSLAFVFPDPIIILIALLAAYETYRRWEQRRKGGAEAEAFYRVSAREPALVGAVYLGLVAVLVIGMSAAHLPRTLS